MNHRFRFRTSGNPTKHMPIGYLSLWVQPRSVTSVDLSWPWTSSGTMSRDTSSHVLIDTNLINYPHSSQSHHAKLRLLTISLKSCRRLFLLWRHNFVTWPDPTKFFWPKVAQSMPHKLWKISARFSKRCGVQLRKTHGGLHQPPPPTGRGLTLHSSAFRFARLHRAPTAALPLLRYTAPESPSCYTMVTPSRTHPPPVKRNVTYERPLNALFFIHC